ncbi:imelysin family protein [Aquimarina litoralis]|uniref:imelysin family protein n=1 Tax=Aquimarina litoralis TaxID=584605 RepID=UPI001C561166|nr:imelysin family protein [Aquimarina litoralis]MBW1297442.1 peptidase M75 superfamily protein [Aquimarina litoralis]
MKKFWFLSVFVFALIMVACSSSDDGGVTVDNFDREAMLENLADNIIVPAYQNFSSDMSAFKTAASNFTTTTNETNLVALREAWLSAFVSWQSISMFEIGMAEAISYRNFMNVYPVNTANIESNISSGMYDLSSINLQDEQGFGAVDYLINGIADSDANIVAVFADVSNGDTYKSYLTDIVDRMDALTSQVVTDWTTNYRDTFVNNSGSSATSSVDRIVNDFIFHYEKHLRAGKIGIPAGVFSGTPLEDRVEGFYKGDISKMLFNANLDALQDFFNGEHFSSSATGQSLKTYLDFLNTIKEGEDLSTLINNQFNVARTTATNLSNDFSEQVRTNNSLMLNTYDELQKNVVLIKVDMLQAISVNVDFVDADGD